MEIKLTIYYLTKHIALIPIYYLTKNLKNGLIISL